MMTHVPYKGAGPLSIDLIAGRIALAFPAPTGVAEYLKNWRPRAFVITGASRLATLPDVPTSKEARYPEFEVNDCYGVSPPANTPKEIVARFNMEFTQAFKLPDLGDRLVSVGLEPSGGSSEGFTAYLKVECQR